MSKVFPLILHTGRRATLPPPSSTKMTWPDRFARAAAFAVAIAVASACGSEHPSRPPDSPAASNAPSVATPSLPLGPLPRIADVRAWGVAGTGVWLLTDGGDLLIGRDPESGWRINHPWSGRPLAAISLADARWLVVVRSPLSTTNADGLDLSLLLEVFRSGDDGASWQSVDLADNVAGTTPSLSFWSPNEGALLLGAVRHSPGRSLLLTTDDAGATWTRPLATTAPWLTGPSTFTSPDRGWVVGATAGDQPPIARELYATDDGGSSWRTAALPVAPGFRPADRAEVGAPIMSTSGSQRLLASYAFGDQGMFMVAESADGLTWREIGALDVLVPNLADVSQTGGVFAVASGSPLAIHISVDGGRTWSSRDARVFLPGEVSLRFASALRGWALVTDSTGLADLYETNDGAMSWILRSPRQ